MLVIYNTTQNGTIFTSAEFKVSEIVDNCIYFARWRPGRYEIQNFEKLNKYLEIKCNDKDIQFTQVQTSIYKLDLDGFKKEDVIKVSCCFRALKLDAGNNCFNENNTLNILPVIITPFCKFSKNSGSSPIKVKVKHNKNIHIISTLEKLETKQQKLQLEEGVISTMFIAKDINELFDSPIIGANKEANFNEIDIITDFDTKIKLYIVSPVLYTDTTLITKQFSDLCNKVHSMFGFCPIKLYNFYVFMDENNIYHGVEHLNSTVITIGSKKQIIKKDNQENQVYSIDLLVNADLMQSLEEISCHEFIHVWNGKFTKPKELLKCDYQNELIFETCYILEGITSFLPYKILDNNNNSKPLIKKYLQYFLDYEYKNNKWESLANYSRNLWRDGYDLKYVSSATFIYVKAVLIFYLLDDILINKYETSVENVIKNLVSSDKVKQNGYTKKDLIQSIIKETNDKIFTINFIEKYFYQTKYTLNEEFSTLFNGKFKINFDDTKKTFEVEIIG